MTWREFMLESNRIEGEDRINFGDMEAIDYAINGIDTLQDIFNLHLILGRYLNQSWVGKLRKVDVRVGSFVPPKHQNLFMLMSRYAEDLPQYDSWVAHNLFEKIHPFQDLNGRVGRLIWLSKAIKEGYNFEIPFLQQYYYQTLDYYERKEA